jgi:hypothetical protein
MRLLASNDQEIIKYLDDLDKESKALKKEILKMCWFMRGGLTYDEAMFLSQFEREAIVSIVEENLEISKKSGLNFF